MKRVPPGLLALGRSDPPGSIDVEGNTYRFDRLFKHDFFAATALYVGPAGKVVLKLGRTADILGLPAEWIGRLLARREAWAYRLLADLEAVPEFLGRWGRTGIVHVFIEGQPLSPGLSLPDDFFERLKKAIEKLHDRGMAYVDLEKPENVLLGADGRPYLIDFQIAWTLTTNYKLQIPPARWVRDRLQEGDRYHLLKLHRRYRRDQLSDDDIARSYRKPPWVRFHRWLTAPFQRIRRRTLNRLDATRQSGERGTHPPDGR